MPIGGRLLGAGVVSFYLVEGVGAHLGIWDVLELSNVWVRIIEVTDEGASPSLDRQVVGVVIATIS